MKDRIIHESELAAVAKALREEAGKSKAETARALGVSEPTVFQAEEKPGESLNKLRIRMISLHSGCEVTGPVYLLREKHP